MIRLELPQVRKTNPHRAGYPVKYGLYTKLEDFMVLTRNRLSSGELGTKNSRVRCLILSLSHRRGSERRAGSIFCLSYRPGSPKSTIRSTFLAKKDIFKFILAVLRKSNLSLARRLTILYRRTSVRSRTARQEGRRTVPLSRKLCWRISTR